jgi:hypothetical protein
VIEHIKNIAEIIALVCAGGYFFYRTWTGYFRVNLSLSIECARQAADPEHDVLAITAVLKKGGTAALLSMTFRLALSLMVRSGSLHSAASAGLRMKARRIHSRERCWSGAAQLELARPEVGAR